MAFCAGAEGTGKLNKILTGRKQIQGFVGRAWEIIMRWVRDDGFPAKKIDGIWESDADLILEWRRKKIKGAE